MFIVLMYFVMTNIIIRFSSHVFYYVMVLLRLSACMCMYCPHILECESPCVFVCVQDADYTQLTSNPATLLAFKDDFRTNMASTFSLSHSQVQVMDVHAGSVVTSFVVTASSSAGLAAINTTFTNLAAQPMSAFNTTFASTYGVSSASFSQVSILVKEAGCRSPRGPSGVEVEGAPLSGVH